MRRTGRAHLLPDDVDTDQILPGEYLRVADEREWGEHALEGYDGDYPAALAAGDVIVGGTNFGTGSSRESAPWALRYAGVGAVVAESFARIFYRNCINVGLLIATVPGITDHVDAGDEVRVDVANGTVTNETTGASFDAEALPDHLQEILLAGGLVAHRSEGTVTE